jgi:hypothetical protein
MQLEINFVHRIMAVISRKTPYLPQEVFLLK